MAETPGAPSDGKALPAQLFELYLPYFIYALGGVALMRLAPARWMGAPRSEVKLFILDLLDVIVVGTSLTSSSLGSRASSASSSSWTSRAAAPPLAA